MQHDPRATVLDIIQAAERAQTICAGLSREEFLGSVTARYAAWAQIVIMGEAVRRIPDDWRRLHPEIPWSKISGMRNRLVHGYDIIDWQIVWSVVHQELPPLVTDLRPLLDSGKL